MVQKVLVGSGNIQDPSASTSTTDQSYRQFEDQDNDPEYESRCARSCCHPAGMCHRFIALFFMCFLGFGSYFCYDNPAALMDYFSKDLNLSTTQYSLLYSLYSWPNVVLCFIGGFLIDRVFGIGLGTNLYMLITLIGQVVFSMGVMFDIFWVMVLGRFVFGIGCESLAVAQNNYAVLWFKGKELNMVFGLQLSFARVGSAVNFWVMESIYKWVNQYYKGAECLGIVIFIATSTCVASMLCSLILGCLNKRADRILRRSENTPGEVVRLGDITTFPSTFWLISVICVAYYIAIFPFIAIGKKFFIEKFHLEPPAANYVCSIVYLISAVASPVLGLLIDKTGKNVLYVLFSIMATIAAHLILILCDLNPYYGMVLMGLSYSTLASSLWPLVALIIPEYQLGTAYGICQAVQNLGLAVALILSGLIVDQGGYFWVEMFFTASLSVALITTLSVWILDNSRGGVLNMTPGQRDRNADELLINNDSDKPDGTTGPSDFDPNDSLMPSSDFHIRNRYLSRIGAVSQH